MEQASELGDSLNSYFQWNKARITVFAQMLLALRENISTRYPVL